MTDAEREEIVRLYAEGLSPYKIALSAGLNQSSVVYALDHKGERRKNTERVRRWRERRKRA